MSFVPVEVGTVVGKWRSTGLPYKVPGDQYWLPVECTGCGAQQAVRKVKFLTAKRGGCKSCRHSTHGYSSQVGDDLERTLYKYFSNMHTRTTTDHRAFRQYQERGITVAPEWAEFPAFLQWARQGYQPGLTLDRIDNHRGYGPDNCHWVDWFRQANNRTNNHLLTAFGEVKTLADWAQDARCAVGYKTLEARVRRGWPPHLALLESATRAA